ncbi:MAG: cell division protein FtsW [Elusimicrobia bacterium RIFCSPHIGHO2_02_FULL_57_9]|nr:MAG: cell division protein FtsW [Elusimicrobia bacterium RIFCSPHIGHO2_02_FULL_57_9]
MSSRRHSTVDFTLLGAMIALVCWGLVMIYSASAIWAEQNLNDSLFFFKRQLLWAAVSLPVMGLVSRINYNRAREWVWPIFIVTVLGLVGALFSEPIAGVRRWIRVGPVGFQPAEFAKLTAVLFLAYYMDRKRSKADSVYRGLVVPMSFVGLLLLLIGKGPDLGTPVLVFSVSLLMLFIGGARVQYILVALACSLPLAAYEIIKYPYRRARLLSFLTPFEDPRGAGYQLAQSILAVGSGGWLGKGFGASKLKLMYLPTPHTDFIFPVVCEELGLLGALGLLALFATVLVRGVRIARAAPNLFGTLLASGITFTISLQAFFNIGMSIGLLPTKGIPLPFISFGGSSLLANLIAVGILLNISRQANKDMLMSTRTER